MAKRILLISLVLISLSMGYKLVQSIAADQTQVEQAFSATVMITMYGFEPEAESVNGIVSQAPQSGITQGLGTLVSHNGQQLIVTHDHWHLLDGEIELVQFRNAQEELVAQVRGEAFHNLIQYRDGGTMILSKPAEMADAIDAVNWNDAQSLETGSLVQVIYRNRDGQGGIASVEATVETVLLESGVPALSLRSTNGHVIVPGDSGGGIWLNGQLIGNLWMTITKEIWTTAESQEVETRIEQNWSMAARLTSNIQNELPSVNEQVPSQEMATDTDVQQVLPGIQVQGLPPAAPVDGVG
jgi:hypothetical protein